MNPPVIAILKKRNKVGPSLRKTSRIRTIAFLGNYLPRKCGIATFTSDLAPFSLFNSIQPVWPSPAGAALWQATIRVTIRPHCGLRSRHIPTCGQCAAHRNFRPRRGHRRERSAARIGDRLRNTCGVLNSGSDTTREWRDEMLAEVFRHSPGVPAALVGCHGIATGAYQRPPPSPATMRRSSANVRGERDATRARTLVVALRRDGQESGPSRHAPNLGP